MLKNSKIYFILFFILIIVIFIFLKTSNSTYKLTSPLPSFANLSDNQYFLSLDFWLPKIKTNYNLTNAPKITAKSALIFDLKSNKEIYSKNPELKLPMASLTKIMTAIIALENDQNDNTYEVKTEYLVGENSMGIKDGETFTLEELLYGLILHSGNDAAETIAGNFSKGRIEFIKAMNQKVKILGLSNTNFTNPSGLEGDGNQYTTAYDLLVITNYALKNFSLFRKVVSTYEHRIPATKTHNEYVLFNETNLLTSYSGIKGVKTGYTFEAGWCLVSYYDNEDIRLIGILLGSENRREEMKQLLDYSITSLGKNPPAHL